MLFCALCVGYIYLCDENSIIQPKKKVNPFFDIAVYYGVSVDYLLVLSDY